MTKKHYHRHLDHNAPEPSETLNYEVVPCPNHLLIKERFGDCVEAPGEDIYQTTGDDNEASMSWEHRRFFDIMKKGVHKNQRGNWEMPLPLRSEPVRIPNNRSQAISCLNGLLRSFKRKPQLKKDYCEFLSKIIERGQASSSAAGNNAKQKKR